MMALFLKEFIQLNKLTDGNLCPPPTSCVENVTQLCIDVFPLIFNSSKAHWQGPHICGHF